MPSTTEFGDNLNETAVHCPKCRWPGMLYSTRSLDALIGSKHIAHVLHTPTPTNRRICLLTRSQFEQLVKQSINKEQRRRFPYMDGHFRCKPLPGRTSDNLKRGKENAKP
jgi:hypothetical protein